MLCPLVLFCGDRGLSLPLSAVEGLPCCAGSCRAVSPCGGVCCVGLFGVVFCPSAGCPVVLSAPPPSYRVLCGVVFFGCVLVVLPPYSPRLVVVPSVVRCRASCRVVLRSEVFFVFWLVLCGVLVFGLALALCCPAPCCAGSCCAVFAVSGCCVLLCSLLVVFVALFLAFLWCSGLFLPMCCPAVVRLAAQRWPYRVAVLCWFLLHCAVWRPVVPWCVSSFCAVLFVSLRCSGRVLPRPLLWWVVVLCFSLGAVLCGPAELPVGRVLPFFVPCFRAPPFFVTPLVRCCVGVPTSFLSLCGAVSLLWRWLMLCVFPVVFGCLLLGLTVLCCLLDGPGISWCRVSVVCPCLAAWLAALWVRCGVSLCSAPLCCVLWCCAVVWWCTVVLCCLLPWLSVPVVCFLLCCVLGRCSLPWAVFCNVSLRCVLCVVCVLSWCVGACCWSAPCFVLCVPLCVLLCVPCPLCPVICCAVLSWCAYAVLFVPSVLFLATGAVVRCCVVCCLLPCRAVARSVVLRPAAWVAGCPVVWCGLLCGPALPPWCPAALCCGPWCCVSLRCPAALFGFLPVSGCFLLIQKTTAEPAKMFFRSFSKIKLYPAQHSREQQDNVTVLNLLVTPVADDLVSLSAPVSFLVLLLVVVLLKFASG